MRAISKVAPDWWDYTTLDEEILRDAARLSAEDILQLSRPGFSVRFYDTIEQFYAAEALEYVHTWMQATENEPTGICGPIGPTAQLPIVAQIVNDLQIDVRNGHFWGMDEWLVGDKEMDPENPISFAHTDRALCFDRIDRKLRMPLENIHFPTVSGMDQFSASFDSVRCMVMQGGQGEVKHWAFNDPPKREGQYADAPPSAQEFRKLGTRTVDLHPLTLIQNARTSVGGVVSDIPGRAITVGPRETWKSDRVSIWHPGYHDNAFGIRLTALMISKRIPDSSVPMSLLADHPDVQFSYLRPGIGSCRPDMQ